MNNDKESPMPYAKNRENINTRVTSVDVARLAGVSQATVSRAFNPSFNMRDSTREKVLSAAQALHYAPDAIARSLISNSTNMVAIIMQNATNPFYAQILSAFSVHLQKKGKQILFFYSKQDESIQKLVNQILQYRVDGIIITSAVMSSELADTCSSFGIPVVLFNRYNSNHSIRAVSCDNIQAGRDCADYLFLKGYRSFGFVSSSENASTSLDRQRGFITRLQERGISDCQIYPSNFTYEAGRQTMRDIMESPGGCPEALFCASDLIAAGLIDTAKFEFSLDIPKDLAVVGFDNISLAAYPPYQITTFSQPMDEMIQMVLSLILEPEDGKQITNLNLFPCTLIERETT